MTRIPTAVSRALALTAIAGALAAVPSPASAQARPGAGIARDRAVGEAYDRGYRQGLQRGEQDGRQGRPFDLDRDNDYRNADRGFGNRSDAQFQFRRGYEDGYRTGYDRTGRRGVPDRRGARALGGFNRGDPAVARGFSDGYKKGFEDGEDRDRFEPQRHGDYRDGDNGYQREYGSREQYRASYRTGFSHGYQEGYRDGNRRR